MKVLKAALAALPLLGSLLWLPADANASTLSSGSGSFTATGEVTSVLQADGNTIVTATEVQTLTGTLTGTRVASGTMTFHPDGTFTAHDTGTFTGNIGSGEIVGYQGTGGLAGLHLQGPFFPAIESATTAEGTYSIQFHFDS